ncbi:hypothetical protein BGZ98_009774 [Dissophora globulifera]|nr:hypothetical protein BGZ98_009774 [Dissophora globulifera]
MLVGCSRSVQDALWAAVVEHIRRTDSGSAHQSIGHGSDGHSNNSGTGFSAGVWAWLVEHRTSDSAAEAPSAFAPRNVHTLHLIYRSDRDAQDLRPQEQRASDSDRELSMLTDILVPLLALCSTHLNIISTTVDSTEADLARLSRSLRIFDTKQQRPRRRTRFNDLAALGWSWMDSTDDSEEEATDTESKLGHMDDVSGWATLKRFARRGSIKPADSKGKTVNFPLLRQCFGNVDCIPSGFKSDLASSSEQRSFERQDLDRILEQELRDLSLDESSQDADIAQDGPSVDTSWIRYLLGHTETAIRDLEPLSNHSTLTNGAMLYIKLQACLFQLNTFPSLFDFTELSYAVQDLVRERAFHHGTHSYHRAMNEHLDRQPIPIPWHALSMVHHDAQSKSLEDIERRYYDMRACLPQLSRDFRAYCLQTTIPGTESESGAAVDSTTLLDMMIPTGGLYLEYYSANATALQNHHLVSLDEHWQVLLKSRLSGSQNSTNPMSSTTLTPLPSRSLPYIKDYAEFLQVVDQVRKNYLETCIPSPEAISVLENLDEMQQAESVVFLQSIAVNSPLSPSPNSLPTHLKRHPSISSSRQSLVLSSSFTGLPSVNTGLGIGGDVLTDTLSGKSTSIQAISTANRVGSIGSSSSSSVGAGAPSIHQQLDQMPTELEQQIAEIMQAKRRPITDDRLMSLDVGGQRGASGMSNVGGASSSVVKAISGRLSLAGNTKKSDDDDKAAVQFGWTLHMRHANTQQYAWIWDWLHSHEGSSGQNAVACDSKMYTSSKWVILPAKDLVRSRKEWKVTYGDRISLVSYWFSTRNAKIDLPEYLPRARGSPCRHVIPAETQRSYSKLAKGKPCQIKFKAGDKVYRCKSCATSQNNSAVLCDRCFRSQNHFGHDVVAQLAEKELTCSCHDGKSWKPELKCSYHSPGVLENEYIPQPIAAPVPSSSLWIRPRILPAGKSVEKSTTPSLLSEQSSLALNTSSTSHSHGTTPHSHAQPHRCKHVFQPGEDIYHCRDCSFHEMVVLCSRCFHNSGCINHRWRMGAFQSPVAEADSPSMSTPGTRLVGRRKRTDMKSMGGDVNITTPSSSATVASLAVAGESTDESSSSEQGPRSPKHAIRVSCDCGDPTMFKTSFDCTYHLPHEFRPVASLAHCNYLFQRNEVMYRCRTCHFASEQEQGDGEVVSSHVGSKRDTAVSEVWICRKCFDTEDHQGHDIEEVVNERNEGFYCHCGDPTILRNPVASIAAGNEGAGAPTASDLPMCRDDHNRQNVLCTAEITAGVSYYQCKTCQTDPRRIFCEPCFMKEAHEGHVYELCTAPPEFEATRCGCGENSAFRFATHCQQHERVGGTNVVHRCQYRAQAGEWIALCNDCYPSQEGRVPSYLCLRCRQGSDHKDHTIQWIKAETDMSYPCACGSHSLSRLSLPLSPIESKTSLAKRKSSVSSSLSGSATAEASAATLNPPPLCQYHTMNYKTTPSTTLFLHSHNYRSINHQDHNEVTGYKYNDSNNDWIITRPEDAEKTMGSKRPGHQTTLSPYLQWKDVFWLRHVNTNKYFNSMASLRISQGFQEVTTLEVPHSNNDWVVEETTWLRQQILSDD